MTQVPISTLNEEKGQDQADSAVKKFENIIENRTGFGIHQILILFLLGLTQGILLSLDISVRIFVNGTLLNYYHFEPKDVVTANTLLFIGVLIGGLLTGFLAN